MRGNGDIGTLPALQIIQSLCAARGVVELARAFLRSIESLTLPPAPVMACFQLDATAQTLVPVAALGVSAAKLPPIQMSELENPAVFSLVRGKAYFLTDFNSTSASHPSLKVLGAAMKWPSALLALPLRDQERDQAVAVLLAGGGPSELQALRQSEQWSALLRIFQRLLGLARHHEIEVPPAKQAHLSARAMVAKRMEEELIGNSVAARRLRAEVLAAADSRLSVLITGETGVGKDHAAWLIHQASVRRGKAFVPVNCAAIARDLIASELFGAAKGAYTGADRARSGLVAAADGGTLFLDEIGDMPIELQATLLRLLNEKRFRALGEVEEKSSDFRLICATHQPLQELIKQGRFREDLYFRLRQLTLLVPPLRERRNDILLLAESVIARHNREQRNYVSGLTPEAQTMLLANQFPGNVRQLISVIQVACERAAETGQIDAATLDSLLDDSPGTVAIPVSVEKNANHVKETFVDEDLTEACERFERMMIASRLDRFKGSRAQAAASLGIPRRTLSYKCKKFSLDVDS